jgi:hypothetical protein
MTKISPLVLLLLSLALACPSLAKTPTGQISVTLKTFEGHEGGYGPPKVGSKLNFSLKDLPELKTIEFGNAMEYVPLMAGFKIIDVDWKADKWDSLRAVSDDSRGHKVILDLQKVGAKNQIRCWIVVESRKRTMGVLYCEGTYK